MKNRLLEEFWYGNLSPFTEACKPDEETKRLVDLMVDSHNKLSASLDEEQKALLECFEKAYDELSESNDRKIFAYGFRLGAQMALAMMGVTE